jgi:hypothetical protein
MGIQVLTHLAKLHRVARQVDDPSNFLVVPGRFVQLLENEMVQNVAEVQDGVPWVKMSITNWSANEYESQDSRGVGRITTLEDIGWRVKLSRDLYFGDSTGKKNGAKLVVQTAEGDQNGFLHFTDEQSIDGSYPCVAVLEGIDGDYITVKIIQQTTYTSP